ncbi:MAG: PAS domain S-box protein [Pyrinomonadaceae bacterium]|nr:PAS domain S-box protein [Pyrinomonadaceae bacterium]
MLSHTTISKLAGAPSCAVLLLAFCASAHSQSSATLPGGVVGQNGAQDIRVTEIASVLNFDNPQPKPWGIGKDRFPLGIVIIQEATFWEVYKWRLTGVFALILLQTLLIAFLLIERSKRLSATNRLLASQEQFAKAFKINPQPMSLSTLVEGRYIDVNDSFLRMSGYTREEVLGRTSIELNLWQAPEMRAEFVKLLESKGWLRNIETKFRTRDGSFRVLLSSFELLPLETQTCILTASSDITERTQSEERFRRFFDLPLAGMAITSPARQFLVVNQTLSKMLGYSAEELTTMTWSQVTHPEDVAENQRLLEQTLRGETEGYTMDKRFIHRDGRIVYTSISTRCVRREDGGVDHLFLVVQDITERKQAEDWLSQLTARLLKSQDEERRRIATELHDVTAQGIGVILLNLAYLNKATPQIDSRGKDKLDECIALGEQALREIRTLSYVLHPPLLDQAGLVTALHWYAKGFTERSGIKVDFREDRTDGHRMPADVEHSLFRVVQECLTNISRHTTSESASITLARTEGEVVLQVRDGGAGLRVSVPTNGDGIESLGVGIPGMRHRLKQLGGELAIDSAPNGTTVTATVPITWVSYDSHNVG